MRTLILLLLTLSANAQCETNRIGQSYLAIPGFFSLYFNGQCIEKNMSDTTICIKVPRLDVGQIASFSYSSPNGAPAFVDSVIQYDNTCTPIEYSPLIAQGSDTVTVCYKIRTELIDNFCPYLIQASALSVDWGGIYAYHSDGSIYLRFMTMSNAGTKQFEVIHSKDAQMWQTLAIVKPFQVTSSREHDYNLNFPFNQGGDNYFGVREVDYNGNVSVSEIVYVRIEYPSKEISNFDILGRRVDSDSFMFYVQPSK